MRLVVNNENYNRHTQKEHLIFSSKNDADIIDTFDIIEEKCLRCGTIKRIPIIVDDRSREKIKLLTKLLEENIIGYEKVKKEYPKLLNKLEKIKKE